MHINEQEKVIISMFNDARQRSKKEGGTILSYFAASTVSVFDKQVYAYLKLVINKHLPLSIIESQEFRNVSKYSVSMSIERFTNIIFALVELVEKKIGNEMQDTKGAILFDGWSTNDMHFTAIIASYCTSSEIMESNTSKTISVHRLSLLAISPMGQLRNKDEDTNDETTRFNAEAYVQFICDTFAVYHCNFDEWCVALIGDSASTNLRVSKLTGKPHIGCLSHKLHLEVRSMINRHIELKNVIESVHRTMKEVKSKSKSAAVLRNLTELHPVLDNETRWSGKVLMLKRFIEIRSEIIEASEHEDSEFYVNTSPIFAARTSRHYRMLREIDAVTKSLQIRGRTLAECRGDIDTLIEAVREEKSKPGSDLFGCKLETKYIGPNSRVTVAPIFESAVNKIQEGLTKQLTDEERKAVKTLEVASSMTFEDASTSSTSSMEQRLAKRRKLRSSAEYMDAKFLLGSSAEVERVFSAGKLVLSQNRKAMSPQLFEALIFLVYNNRFWDVALVGDAIAKVRAER